jgi:hypothetical protein
MPTCIHGWGSDGVNPSGCPQCDQMARESDREELIRLRARVAELEGLLVGPHKKDCSRVSGPMPLAAYVYTHTEVAIRAAMAAAAVEAMPADPRLTNAGIALAQALDLVSSYVDQQMPIRLTRGRVRPVGTNRRAHTAR